MHDVCLCVYASVIDLEPQVHLPYSLNKNSPRINALLKYKPGCLMLRHEMQSTTFLNAYEAGKKISTAAFIQGNTAHILSITNI